MARTQVMSGLAAGERVDDISKSSQNLALISEIKGSFLRKLESGEDEVKKNKNSYFSELFFNQRILGPNVFFLAAFAFVFDRLRLKFQAVF